MNLNSTKHYVTYIVYLNSQLLEDQDSLRQF